MRIWLLVAAPLLLGVESLPVRADGISQGSRILSCAVLAGQTALPDALCRHLAVTILGASRGFDVSELVKADPVWARRPAAETSPMAPGTSLKISAAWQAHLDRGIAHYHQIFNGPGLAYTLPAAPSVLWPGGNPFVPRTTD